MDISQYLSLGWAAALVIVLIWFWNSLYIIKEWERGVVLRFGFCRRSDPFEHEAQRADQQRVENEHAPTPVPASSEYSRSCKAATGQCT